jgi:hypothetical protein
MFWLLYKAIIHIATHNFHKTTQQKPPIIIKHHLNMILLTYFVLHIYSICQFYISHSNANEISYFKDIANCIPKNAF